MAPLTRYYETASEMYRPICELILRHGSDVCPRGKRTKELLNPTIVLAHPEYGLPWGVGRKIYPTIGAVEAVQLCGGFANDDMMAMMSEFYASLREPDDGKFHGAYGRRIGTQLDWVLIKLSNDPYTRQAVITLWDPALDNTPGKRDYPCTVSLHFYIRDDSLHLTTNMRSNDAWLGLTYDLFQFGQLQWTLANMLGIKAGHLVHRPVSLHLYEEHWDLVDTLRYSPAAELTPLYGFTSSVAARLIGQHADILDEDAPSTETEHWYVHQLGPVIEQLKQGAP